MFQNLYHIGRFESQKRGKNPEQIALEINLEGVNKVLLIQLESVYCKLDIKMESIDTQNLSKYGAYGKNTNGANILFYDIFKGSEASSSKKGITTIATAFKNNFFPSDLDHPVKKLLETNRDSIIKELESLATNLSKDEIYLLTLSYSGKYVYEIPEFAETIKQKVRDKNINKSHGDSFKENGHCTICGSDNVTLVGLLYLDETFNFFNYADPIYAKGVNVANAYKNTSICSECAEYINLGSRVVVQQTNHNVRWMKTTEKGTVKQYGHCVTIPRFIHGASDTSLALYNLIITRYLAERAQASSTKNNTIGLLEELIAEEKDLLCFDFIYYSKAQRKVNVLFQIREVMPSRLHYLIEIGREVNRDHGKRVTGTSDYYFNLETSLFQLLTLNHDLNEKKVQHTKTWYGDYFTIINALYKGHKLSKPYVMALVNKYMLSYIQEYKHHQRHDSYYRVFDVYLYLLLTETISTTKEEIMDFSELRSKFENKGLISKGYNDQKKPNSYEQVTNRFFQYWETYKNMYTDYASITAFCLGNIASLVRYHRRGKGCFVDDWLTNITTNISKLDQFFARAIESLSIERTMDMAHVKIPLALVTFFKDNEDNLLADRKGFDLVFPFVSGFMFRSSNELEDDESDDTTNTIDTMEENHENE